MIITNNEAALRLKSEDAKPDEVGSVINLLDSELDNSARLGKPGVGLASPQCGIYKNIAIVRLNDIKINLVNCKIKTGYDKQVFTDEGCLSFPGRVENTMRFQEIYVVENEVEPYNFTASGLLAVVIQHELDHLNGIILPDVAIPKQLKNKIGPNDPCICGKTDPISGKVKKYKKCCGDKK